MRIFSWRSLRVALLLLCIPLGIFLILLFTIYLGLEKATLPAERHLDAASIRSTQSGAVQGFATPAGIQMWLGIPYAQPVSGDQRWTLPEASKAWPGILPLLVDPPPCFQFGQPFDKLPEAGHIGVEDCLTLDIAAPKFTPENVPGGADRLPVMVWIHGGGNSIGTPGDLSKSKLVLQNKMIVVSVRYRLGPFGWFSHQSLRDTGVPSSNFGTEDLILALHWVQNNIAAFGGDPQNITLLGQSAGGFNSFSLMLSPGAGGLFQRAIIQSAGALTTTRADAENPRLYATGQTSRGRPNNSSDIVLKLLLAQGLAPNIEQARTLAETLPAIEMAALLRSVPPLQLIKTYQRHNNDKMFRFPNIIRDGYTIPLDTPQEIIAGGELSNAVPVIFGTNRDELKPLLLMNKKLAPRNFLGIPMVSNKAAFNRVSYYLASGWKISGADQPANWLVSAGHTKQYVYRFDWDEQPGYFGIHFSDYFGASHNTELPFVVGQFEKREIPWFFLTRDNAPGREELSANIRHYWAEFARSGTPGTGGSKNLPHWQPWSVQPREGRTLTFDTPGDGGIHQQDLRLEKKTLTKELLQDAVLDIAAKCDILQTLTTLNIWTETDLERFGNGLCPPHDEYDLEES